jgi:hypothetical protein
MFLSQENKGFLWDLMLENETFKKEIDTNVLNVKKTFESLLVEIDKNNKTTDLLDKNKLFLVELNLKMSNNKLVTNKEISNKRVSDFESRLQKRQNDFTISMKKETPEEISFEDNMDQPLLNVEDELQKKINERKYDNIDISNENVTEAKEWIGIELKDDISLNKIEEIHTLPVEIVGDTFIPETDVDIFSKLKKVEPINSNNDMEIVLFHLKKMDRKIDMLIEYIQNTTNNSK